MIEGRSPIAFERDGRVVVRFITNGSPVECVLEPIAAGWLGIDIMEVAHRVHTKTNGR